jgi:hypothetical protein
MTVGSVGTGLFADVMVGLSHDAEARSFHAFYGAHFSSVYRTGESLYCHLGNTYYYVKCQVTDYMFRPFLFN